MLLRFLGPAATFAILAGAFGFGFRGRLAALASERDSVNVLEGAHLAAPDETQRARDNGNDRRIIFGLHAQHVIVNVPLEVRAEAIKEAGQVRQHRLAARPVVRGEAHQLRPENRVHFDGVIAAADQHQGARGPLLGAVGVERVGIRGGRRKIRGARPVREAVCVRHEEILTEPLRFVKQAKG